MINTKSLLVVVVVSGLFCSLHAMEFEDKKMVTYGQLMGQIEQGAQKIETNPKNALAIFQQVYNQAENRRWLEDVKDKKLALMLYKPCSEESEDDVCDVSLWKLLLDKVDILRNNIDGLLKDKVTLFLACTAKKLADNSCSALSLAYDCEVAYEAEELKKTVSEQTKMERLDYICAQIKRYNDRDLFEDAKRLAHIRRVRTAEIKRGRGVRLEILLGE